MRDRRIAFCRTGIAKENEETAPTQDAKTRKAIYREHMIGKRRHVSTPWGDYIRRARKRKGWRQSDLAKKAGIAESTISHQESKGQAPKETFGQIVRALGLDPAEAWNILQPAADISPQRAPIQPEILKLSDLYRRMHPVDQGDMEAVIQSAIILAQSRLARTVRERRHAS